MFSYWNDPDTSDTATEADIEECISFSRQCVEISKMAHASNTSEHGSDTASEADIEECVANDSTSKAGDKIKYMYNTRKSGDVKFNIKYLDEDKVLFKNFYAHSVLLKWASPVFKTMLESDFKEKSCEIVIEDISPEAFELFLNFVYLDHADISSDQSAWELYGIGTKYMFVPFQNFCLNYIKSQLAAQTALNAYCWSNFYDLDEIKTLSYEVILTDTYNVLMSPDFMNLTENAVSELLDEGNLKISEVSLFKRVELWVHDQVLRKGSDKDEQGKMKKHLCDLLMPKFRFLQMSNHDFLEGPNLSDLLTVDQKLSIITNLNSKTPLKLADGITMFAESRGTCHLKCQCATKQHFCYKFNESSNRAEFKPTSYMVLSDSIKFNNSDGFISFSFITTSQSGSLISRYICDDNFFYIGVHNGMLYLYISPSNEERWSSNSIEPVNDGKPHSLSLMISKSTVNIILDDKITRIDCKNKCLDVGADLVIGYNDKGASHPKVNFSGLEACISSIKLSDDRNHISKIDFQKDHQEINDVNVCKCEFAVEKK